MQIKTRATSTPAELETEAKNRADFAAATGHSIEQVNAERERQAAFDANDSRSATNDSRSNVHPDHAFGDRNPNTGNPNTGKNKNQGRPVAPVAAVETPATEAARRNRIAQRDRTPQQIQDDAEQGLTDSRTNVRTAEGQCSLMVAAEIGQLMAEINNTPTAGLNGDTTEALLERLECIRDCARDGHANFRASTKWRDLPGQIDLTIPHRPSVGEYNSDQAYLAPTARSTDPRDTNLRSTDLRSNDPRSNDQRATTPTAVEFGRGVKTQDGPLV